MEIEIADTGCGIAPAHIEHIFEPFFTTKEYGTGLGVTNVKRLIQENGGFLEVQNQEGAGSRFVTRFPVAQATPAAIDVAPARTEATVGSRRGPAVG